MVGKRVLPQGQAAASSGRACGGMRSAGRGASGRSPSVLIATLVAGALALAGAASAETWRGLTVAPEYRCSAYDRQRDYPLRVLRRFRRGRDAGSVPTAVGASASALALRGALGLGVVSRTVLWAVVRGKGSE